MTDTNSKNISDDEIALSDFIDVSSITNYNHLNENFICIARFIYNTYKHEKFMLKDCKNGLNNITIHLDTTLRAMKNKSVNDFLNSKITSSPLPYDSEYDQEGEESFNPINYWKFRNEIKMFSIYIKKLSKTINENAENGRAKDTYLSLNRKKLSFV